MATPSQKVSKIQVRGAAEHNLKSIDVAVERGAITIVTGVSGSGKSSLAFDTILAEANRRFFYTLSHYSRQFLDMGARPAVQHISGLSPAIALAQNETTPSRRATVGTTTDVGELLGVLFSNFGEQRCPKHGELTQSQSLQDVSDQIVGLAAGKTIAICAPIAEAKKGVFAAEFARFLRLGFTQAYVDGEVRSIEEDMRLAREEKHTIKIVIDQVKVKPESKERLRRSLESALDQGEGFGEWFPISHQKLDLQRGRSFSTQAGCPRCGWSWPRLDSRYFSANSLGKCPQCRGFGVEEANESWEMDDGAAEEADDISTPCAACAGTGVKKDMGAIRVAGRSIQDILLNPVEENLKLFESIDDPKLRKNPAFQRVVGEIIAVLKRMNELDLRYLNLARRIVSLSGGEAQRLRLASILGEHLRGVLYVLDEPSQGLHPTEILSLVEAIKRLRDQGNTVVIVDHDELLMKHADWIVDLGPGGGHHGGRLMAAYKPSEANLYVKDSPTARFLAHSQRLPEIETRKKPAGPFISIIKPALNNLSMDSVRFLKGGLNVVTGVSGAGKSSLVLSVLYQNGTRAVSSKTKKPWIWCREVLGLEGFETAWMIDRRPVAKTTVSIPATYLDVFGDIRDIYAKLPESQIAGLDARSFSLNVEGGRCEHCHGRGEIVLSMRFLADARVRCPVCQGLRYRQHVCEIKFSGLSIADVLELTLQEAAEHFVNFKRIASRLQPALDLGLGYLKMGQTSASLSGGESQRLKLVPLLGRRHSAANLVVIDEPTTGLHFADVECLMRVVRGMVVNGATVIIIEHHPDVIWAADWVVDIGPGAASDGGRLLYEGPPEGLRGLQGSPTGRFLGEL